MKRTRILIFTLTTFFLLVLNSTNLFAKNIKYGATTSMNFISEEPLYFIYITDNSNVKPKSRFMFGPTVEINHPKLERLSLDASFTIDRFYDIGIPVFLNYNIDRISNLSLGLGIYQYHGSLRHSRIDNYTYWGIKAQKRWNIGSFILEASVAHFFFGRSIDYEDYTGGYYSYKYNMRSLSLTLKF